MKGVQATNFGGPEVLQYKTDLPIPTPRGGEILVKNEFIGVNYVDVYWRIGMMGPAPNGILGREAEGTVAALGPGINNLTVGSRVVFYAQGSYAEYSAVPAGMAYPVPPDVKPSLAAASMMQGLTALTLTQKVYAVQKGDWVLAHAAAGGVGLWLCQLLKAAGARTIGTASTAEKMALARENGAEFTVNYRKEDVAARVEEITGGQGVNVVYDSVGKDQAENNFKVLAKGGTFVMYGVSSGIPAPASPAKLAAKDIRFIGPAESALMRSVGTPSEFATWCAKLFDLVAQEKVTVRIHGTYPLSDMAQVHRDLESRKTMGKVLVKP
ncbi:MAG: hypothetical protein Q9195_003241 [Heterodermia aff. obscurata]